MNYIKWLESERLRLMAEKAEALDALVDLQKYLSMPKFTSLEAGDRRFLVNVEDVLARIAPAKTAVLP